MAVGPIERRSDKKSRYILIDYATRHPEAVALPSIETERVAEALVAKISYLATMIFIYTMRQKRKIIRAIARQLS